MQTILTAKQVWKNGYVLLALLFVLSMILLFLLFLFSTVPNKHLNGFKRTFASSGIEELNSVKLDIPLKSICGRTPHSIYFSVPNLNWTISMNNDLSQVDPVYLRFNITSGLDRTNKIIVDSPHVLLFDFNAHSLYRGGIGTMENDTVYLQTNVFSKVEMLPDHTALIMEIDSSHVKQALLKVDLHNGHVISRLPLKDNINSGGFENDVMIRYDQATNSILLIEYFRNNIFRLDTGLNLRYSLKTIDTIHSNAIVFQSVNIKGEETIMPSTPRMAVNIDAVVSGAYLFIRSALKADNEQAGSFRKNTVIDVYNTVNGNYEGSFYIPDQQGEKLQAFIVRDQVITALFLTYVVNLRLPPAFW